MPVDYVQIAEDFERYSRALDSIADFQEGVKYQFDPIQYVFIDSGYAGGWGACVFRKFSGQTYKELCKDLKSVADSIHDFVMMIFYSLNQDSSKEWSGRADNYLENLMSTLSAAAEGLANLKKTYASEEEKYREVQNVEWHYSNQPRILTTTRCVRRNISERLQSPLI